jgi:FAD/FMN-containing dehydrogenase
MNKVASYLNEHVLGEVSSAKTLRKRYSKDASILSITPEIVVFPRVTNDIRKTTRFTWQLAEKGHPMPVTVRGFGSDVTGSSIGKGIIIDTTTHLNDILNVASKDKLVHVQPGVSLATINETLKWHGLSLTGTTCCDVRTSVGGAIAAGSLGATGSLGVAIDKLEVVLANGDVFETGRVSKHDVNKKLGIQTFEGEIYRKLAGLIEDNEELLARMAADPVRDTTGYRSIAQVRQKDGSFDLTPLFIASQGTLGIISEVVLATDFYSDSKTSIVIKTASRDQARDIVDSVQRLEPSRLEIIDATIFERAGTYGKRFSLLGDDVKDGAVLLMTFSDMSDRARHSKTKRVRKMLRKMEVAFVDSEERDHAEFDEMYEVGHSIERMSSDEHPALPVFDGAFVPFDRLDECLTLIDGLADKHHVELPLSINVIHGTIQMYPQLKLDIVSDKQKIFKLMNAYAEVIHRCNGAFTSDGAEGRLKAHAAWSVLEDEEKRLFEQVREIFDPFNTLNPGVKQPVDIRTVVSALRSSYDPTERS